MSIRCHVEVTTETVILSLLMLSSSLLVCLVVATLYIVWRILKAVIHVSQGERWPGNCYSTVSYKLSRQGSERSASTQNSSESSGINLSLRSAGHHHIRKDVTSLADPETPTLPLGVGGDLPL